MKIGRLYFHEPEVTPRERLQWRLDDKRFHVRRVSATRLERGVRFDPVRRTLVRYLTDQSKTRWGRALRSRLRLRARRDKNA